MKREEFINVAEEALDSLPEEFRSRIRNVAILVEDFPPNQKPPQPGQSASPQLRRASLMFPWVLPTSCFIRRISKRSVRARQKSASKFARHLCTNWGTISA